MQRQVFFIFQNSPCIKKIFIYRVFCGKCETWLAFNISGAYVVNYSLLFIGYQCLVAPLTLIFHWLAEFAHWTPISGRKYQYSTIYFDTSPASSHLLSLVNISSFLTSFSINKPHLSEEIRFWLESEYLFRKFKSHPRPLFRSRYIRVQYINPSRETVPLICQLKQWPIS